MPKITSGSLDKIERYIYDKSPADWPEAKALRFAVKLGKSIRTSIEIATAAEDSYEFYSTRRRGEQTNAQA